MKQFVAPVFALASTVAFAAGEPPLVVKSGQTQQLPAADTLQLRNVTGSTQCIHADASGNLTGTGADCGSSSATPGNPTATASDTAVNGSAGTFLRSDAAPAVQKASASQFGIVKVDGSTITATGGVISASAPNASYQYIFAQTGTFTHAFACSGNLVQPQRNITIYSAGVGLTTVTGATYKIGIAPYDTVNNKITSAPVYSAAFTEGTGIANGWVLGNFGSGFAMTGGANYIIFLVRTDAGTTPSTALQTASALPSNTPGIISLGVSSTSKSFHLASTAPATSDVWTTETGWYEINFNFGF